MSEQQREVASLSRRLWRMDPDAQRAALDLDVARELASSRAVWALPHLVGLALEEAIRDEVGAAILGIVERSDPARLPVADAEVRRGCGWFEPWAELRPRALRRLARRCADPAGFLSAAAMCRNGFLRERAIIELDRYRDAAPEALWRVLLIRANDAVAPVRAAALARVEARARELSGSVLVRSLPLIERLYRTERLPDTRILDDVIALVVDRHPIDLLVGTSNDHLSIRRSCARIALSFPRAPRLAAAEYILETVTDPVCRRLAAETVLAARDDRPTLHRLARDRTPDVRLMVMAHMLGERPVDVELMTTALTDPVRRVRDLAQYHARRQHFDAAQYYRRCLEAGPAPACLAGLGEVGQRDDAQRIVPSFGHPRARVRRAAVGAIGRLAPDGHVALLYRMIDDPSSRVSLAAAKALRAAPQALDPAELLRLMDGAVHPHAVRNAVLLVRNVRRWAQLPLYLHAATHLDEPFAAAAVSRLRDWERSCGTRWQTAPTTEEWDRARASYRSAADALPRDLQARLSHLLQLATQEQQRRAADRSQR